MAFSKAGLYEDEFQLIAAFSKAVSHPARLKILVQLAEEGPCPVEVIAERHPIDRATFSEHLSKLRKAGLISCEERYPYTIYSLDRRVLDLMRRKVNRFMKGTCRKETTGQRQAAVLKEI